LIAAEERVAIEAGERQSLGESTRQVRIGDERPTEGDEIGIALGDDPLGAPAVVVARTMIGRVKRARSTGGSSR